MATIKIYIPKVHETISELKFIRKLVDDDSPVLIDDAICEIETEKAIMELIASSSGTLKWQSQEGDLLRVGDLICTINSKE